MISKLLAEAVVEDLHQAEHFLLRERNSTAHMRMRRVPFSDIQLRVASVPFDNIRLLRPALRLLSVYT